MRIGGHSHKILISSWCFLAMTATFLAKGARKRRRPSSTTKEVVMSRIALCEVSGPLKDLLDKLSGESGDEWLEHLKQMLRKDLVIDCDANPYLPSGWQVEQHLKGGSFKWDPEKVDLFLSKKQKQGGTIVDHELRKKLEGKPVLNANVLDWLLAHPRFIPESWKGKYIFFWGTIYRSLGGHLSVRCLYWDSSRWGWNCSWLDDDFHGYDPAALCK